MLALRPVQKHAAADKGSVPNLYTSVQTPIYSFAALSGRLGILKHSYSHGQIYILFQTTNGIIMLVLISIFRTIKIRLQTKSWMTDKGFKNPSKSSDSLGLELQIFRSINNFAIYIFQKCKFRKNGWHPQESSFKTCWFRIRAPSLDQKQDRFRVLPPNKTRGPPSKYFIYLSVLYSYTYNSVPIGRDPSLRV